jgi:dUTP pyrophosphatase
MTENQVRIKRLHPMAQIPAYASEGDAGADLHAVEDGWLIPGQHTLVPTGLSIELPQGTVGFVHPHGCHRGSSKCRPR